MLFDPNNPIVQLCAQGMTLEGENKSKEAAALFRQAWESASNDLEKLTAAHYLARHQARVADKLKWDQIALQHALAISDELTKGTYPSLYLNIAKCQEDMGDLETAKANYQLALSFCHYLNDDGYGRLIKGGILHGLERCTNTIKRNFGDTT